MTNDAKDFLDDIAGYAADPSPTHRIGTIDPGYSGGRPRVLFDGETVLGAKQYPYLASYTPRASDRVALAPVGSSFVILNALDSSIGTPTLGYGNATPVGTQSIVRRNGIVTVNFWIKTTAASGVQITLPVGYRPSPATANIVFGGAISPPGGSWAPGTFYIDTGSANILILAPAAASGADAAGSVSFQAGA